MLQHRNPFLFLDWIVSCPTQGSVGGHFHKYPKVPGSGIGGFRVCGYVGEKFAAEAELVCMEREGKTGC